MNFKRTVLKNGLRIITVPMKDNPTVTVLVLVEAGSKYETKDINGISHFLEHMCFKGTKRRPTALDITKELDGLGAGYNAFTSNEYTGYYAKAESRHFPKLLDIVSDIYLNPNFDEREIEKEKGVISDEINMYEDLPNRKVGDVFMDLMYGDQPAGWNIAGTKEIIRTFKKSDFIKYRNKHYVAKGTVVVIAGNFDEKKAIKEVANTFSGISQSKKHGKKRVVEKQSKPEVAISHKVTDQTHLILGVRSLGLYDKRQHILDVLASVLGGGMSSRLFQKLRDEMGVGYYITAGNDTYTDHGFLAVSTGVTNKRAEEVVQAILNEFRRLVDEPVSPEELKKVKDHIVGTMYLRLESSSSLAMYYGNEEISRKPIETPEMVARKIRSVSSKDVQKMARNIFTDKKLNLALVGPFKTSSGFKKKLKLS